MAYITNLAHVKTFDGVIYDMKVCVPRENQPPRV